MTSGMSGEWSVGFTATSSLLPAQMALGLSTDSEAAHGDESCIIVEVTSTNYYVALYRSTAMSQATTYSFMVSVLSPQECAIMSNNYTVSALLYNRLGTYDRYIQSCEPLLSITLVIKDTGLAIAKQAASFMPTPVASSTTLPIRLDHGDVTTQGLSGAAGLTWLVTPQPGTSMFYEMTLQHPWSLYDVCHPP